MRRTEHPSGCSSLGLVPRMRTSMAGMGRRRRRTSLTTRSWVLMMFPSSRTCWVKSTLDGRRRCSICSMAFSTWAWVTGIVSGAGGWHEARCVCQVDSAVNGGVQMTGHLGELDVARQQQKRTRSLHGYANQFLMSQSTLSEHGLRY